MMNRINKLDSNEFRTGMLFLWLSFILLMAAVFASRNDDLGFAVFTLVAGAILSFFTGLWWCWQGVAETPQEEPPDLAETTTPAPQAQQGVIDLTPEQLEDCMTLSFFVHQVVEKHLLSQPAWEREHAWPASRFENFVGYVQRAGVISAPPGPGRKRELLVYDIETARQKIDQFLGFDLLATIDYNRQLFSRGKALSPSEEPLAIK